MGHFCYENTVRRPTHVLLEDCLLMLSLQQASHRVRNYKTPSMGILTTSSLNAPTEVVKQIIINIEAGVEVEVTIAA